MASILTLSMGCLAADAMGQSQPMPGIPAADWQAMADFESKLQAVPTPDSLRQWHDKTSSRPHPTGSPGDLANVEMIANAFQEMGLQVERHEFWAYLPRLVSASVTVLPDGLDPIELQLQENPVEADPHGEHPELGIAWNSYSGSGTAEGTVVYANYGRKEDFDRLATMGIDLNGVIVIARYGGNYRGVKAVLAEAAGAAGLLMYTDPADTGYMKGLMYPEGGYQNPSSIQRGSIKSISYPGDALTPGIEATRNAPLIDPADTGLPTIPVQAISWAGAHEILSRMDGPGVPAGWQGGLPFAYRITTSPASVRTRVEVNQPRERAAAYNITGTLRGSVWPDETIVIGCHHDAWGFGAGDPDAGMIVVLEAARSFADLARQGIRPKRTVVFAGWGAEEFGIIGSTEWVEREQAKLRENAVAYLNLDMASMGPNFGSSAHPAVHGVLWAAAQSVPQARDPQRTVYQAWGGGGVPTPGVLGGGSDHIGFLCFTGVPSLSLGGGGSPGVSYHTNYDTLHWYRKVVGDDYEPALMITRMTNAVAARLANAPLLPLDPAAQTLTSANVMRSMTAQLPLATLVTKADAVAGRAQRVHTRLLLLAEQGVLRPFELQRANALLRKVDRAWLDPQGLPGQPWMKNLTVSPDPYSGYGSWTMPALREASSWDSERAGDLAAVLAQHDAALTRVDQVIAELEALVNGN